MKTRLAEARSRVEPPQTRETSTGAGVRSSPKTERAAVTRDYLPKLLHTVTWAFLVGCILALPVLAHFTN